MPARYTVKQGDCISSIAAACGTLWSTIWNYPDNAELKQRRQDPNVLYPGDVVTIPDRLLNQESRGTDNRHQFKKKQSPTHIKVRLLLDDQPRANVTYQLLLGNATIKGTTDGDGYLQQDIPPDTQTGVLIVEEGKARDIFQLGLGTLDPIDTEEGVRERLESLGFDAETDFMAAVRAFQYKQGLDTTGVVDDALRAKLKESFGQ